MTDTDPTPSSTYRAMHALLATLDAIEPMPAIAHEDLLIVPLRSRVAREHSGYVTLADKDTPRTDTPAPFEFTELDAGGSVPTVQVKVGLLPLVVIAGETIVGGKQNRAINVSMWLPQKRTTAIPVSCLEHGRWNCRLSLRARPGHGPGAAREAVAQRRPAHGRPPLQQRPGRRLGAHRRARAGRRPPLRHRRRPRPVRKRRGGRRRGGRRAAHARRGVWAGGVHRRQARRPGPVRLDRDTRAASGRAWSRPRR